MWLRTIKAQAETLKRQDGVCPEGFWGLGGSCFDIDECGNAEFNDCKAGTTCSNFEGGYSCTCSNGIESNADGSCDGKGFQRSNRTY